MADISRVSRDDLGELIGYQRPEVRQHIQEITDYLDSERAAVPEPDHHRAAVDGPVHLQPRARTSATASPPVAPSRSRCRRSGGRKPGWIVDGQQRAFALAAAKRQDFPVPVNAFVADSVDVQRDQFLRINNTKPLPRGLVTELLPKISTPLPPRLSVRQIPSALCDLLNSNDDSPFRGLIRRPQPARSNRKSAVVTDTSLVQALQESLTSPVGLPVPVPQPQQRRDRLHRHVGSPAAVLDRRQGTPSRRPGGSRRRRAG